MPYVRLEGANYALTSGPNIDGLKHLKILSSEILEYRCVDKFTDMRIICKDGSLSAHKVILVNSSKWIANLSEEISDIYGCIVCPEFSTISVSKVLELLYCGVTSVENGYFSEIYDVIRQFGFQVNHDLGW
jgi:hypothetical protein